MSLCWYRPQIAQVDWPRNGSHAAHLTLPSGDEFCTGVDLSESCVSNLSSQVQEAEMRASSAETLAYAASERASGGDKAYGCRPQGESGWAFLGDAAKSCSADLYSEAQAKAKNKYNTIIRNKIK